MTKSEAASALGVSEKTVSRYVAAGRLPARYVRGKTGQKLEVAPDDVERLQLELQSGASAAPPLAPIAPHQNSARAVRDGQVMALARESAAPVESDLASSPASSPSPALTLAALARIVRAVMDMDEAGQDQTKLDKARVPVESKLLLTLDEAAALAGVPRAHLDAARREGQLRARKIGRGFKIRRHDLEWFVENLWEN